MEGGLRGGKERALEDIPPPLKTYRSRQMGQRQNKIIELY